MPSLLVALPCVTSCVLASNSGGSARRGSAAERIAAMPRPTSAMLSAVGVRYDQVLSHTASPSSASTAATDTPSMLGAVGGSSHQLPSGLSERETSCERTLLSTESTSLSLVAT